MTEGRTRVLRQTKCHPSCHQHPGNHSIWQWFYDGMKMHFAWLQVVSNHYSKSILIGYGIRGTSWKPLSFTLTHTFWPQDQCLRTVMLDPIEHVQWWSSFSKMQPLPFCGRHKVPTSIHLRTCETLGWQIPLRHTPVQTFTELSGITPGNPTTSDTMSGPGHEKTYYLTLWTLFEHYIHRKHLQIISN